MNRWAVRVHRRDKVAQRAVGVLYGAAAEHSRRNYVPSVIPRRYDEFVYVDHTSALHSIHRPAARGRVPESWPVGW